MSKAVESRKRIVQTRSNTSQHQVALPNSLPRVGSNRNQGPFDAAFTEPPTLTDPSDPGAQGPGKHQNRAFTKKTQAWLCFHEFQVWYLLRRPNGDDLDATAQIHISWAPFNGRYAQV